MEIFLNAFKYENGDYMNGFLMPSLKMRQASKQNQEQKSMLNGYIEINYDWNERSIYHKI